MIGFIKKLFTAKVTPETTGVALAREDAPRVFARLFSGDDGQKVLAYLRGMVNARVAGPDGSDALLRYQDGQRGLLQSIAGLIEQGRN